MRIRASLRRSRRNSELIDKGGVLARPGTPQRALSPSAKEHVARLVVDVGNRANDWRDAAVDAELAFGRWKDATQEDRREAAAVYLAAIEREEKAANEYSRALEACCVRVP